MVKMKQILSSLLAASMLCSVCGCSMTVGTDKTELLKEAIIYTLPLMMVKATEIKVTNTETAGSNQAPVNQLVQAQSLATAMSTDVVTPNVDTIYTQAFLDLHQDAVIIELPKTDRFCTMQFLDAYTNTITVIDCMTFKNDLETMIITGPDWQGEIPADMTQIKSPTGMVWLIGRTICYNNEDVVHVHEVQNRMDMYTLTAYKNGTTDEKPAGEFVEEENFNPRDFVLSRTMEQYFEMANRLMLQNPPAKSDRRVMKKFAAVNIGPGMEFDASVFGSEEEIAALWKKSLQDVVAQVTAACANFQVTNGIWQMFGDPIADWGTEYGYRAGVALFGLGANPTSVAIYPKTEVDSEGNTLVGTNQYVIHMDADAFPPIRENGFWSITAYNSNDYLIDNELDRYAIKNTTPYILNEDGSLDIYVQAEKPSDEKMLANWLPVSDDSFHLYMRVYLPEESVLQDTWTMPSVTKK